MARSWPSDVVSRARGPNAAASVSARWASWSSGPQSCVIRRAVPLPGAARACARRAVRARHARPGRRPCRRGRARRARPPRSPRRPRRRTGRGTRSSTNSIAWMASRLPRATRARVEKARKISPEPCPAVEPVLARPSPARRASRESCGPTSGASVATTTMQLPRSRGACAALGQPSAWSASPIRTPSTVRRPIRPKLARASTPTV